MEEKKKINWGRVAWKSINVIVAAMVLACVFTVSVVAGISAVVFGALGYTFGYCKRSHKIQKDFFSALLEKREDFFNGKTITVTADEETGALTVVATDTPKDLEEEAEKPQPRKERKKKEAQED